MKATEGDPGLDSQLSFSEVEKNQGWFLSCKSTPAGDLVIGGEETFDTVITAIEELTPSIVKVLINTPSDFTWTAGQFIALTRPDGLSRFYSIASVHSEGIIELHIRIFPDGQMSQWLIKEGSNSNVTIGAPQGNCCYDPENAEDTLILAGTGTGLAPLVGIVKDCLEKQHDKPIHLFHGARSQSSFYFSDELKALADSNSNFHYHEVIGEEGSTPEEVLYEEIKDIEEFQSAAAFLCGNTDLVNKLRKKLFLSGMSMKKIKVDAFAPA